MSNASISKDDELHLFGTTATTELLKKNVTFTELLDKNGIYGVVKILAEIADDRAYETQDHDDDLICMVLEKTEKQIWGLTLSKQHRAQQK